MSTGEPDEALESLLERIEARLASIEHRLEHPPESARLKRILEELAHQRERSTPATARTQRRYRQIREVAELLGGPSWSVAGKMSLLLSGQRTAYGELGEAIARLRKDPDCAKSQSQIWRILRDG